MAEEDKEDISCGEGKEWECELLQMEKRREALDGGGSQLDGWTVGRNK